MRVKPCNPLAFTAIRGTHSEQVTLLAIAYQRNIFASYPQHLPIIIHASCQPGGKLPGAENLVLHEHND